MIDPGEMDTEMHHLAVPNCDYPFAKPEDIVDIFLYLASDKSAGINGQRFEDLVIANNSRAIRI